MYDSRHDTAVAKIQNYLAILRLGLRGLPSDEVDDILREIRSHLLDRAGDPADPGAAAEAIASLGRASDLATRYRTEMRLDEARTSYSPVALMGAVVQWATMSLIGFGVALIGLFGYGAGVGLLLAAALDPIFPDRIGLWVGPDVLVLGIVMNAPEASELLGRWITPIGFVLGLVAVVATNRILHWLIARFATSRSRVSELG